MSKQYSQEELQAIFNKPRLKLDEARILLDDDNIKSLEILSFFFYQIGQYDSAKRGIKALLVLDEQNSFALNMQVLCADALECFDDVVLLTADLMPQQKIDLTHVAESNSNESQSSASDVPELKSTEASSHESQSRKSKSEPLKSLQVDKDKEPKLYLSLLLLRARALQKLQLSNEAQVCIQALHTFKQEYEHLQPIKS